MVNTFGNSLDAFVKFIVDNGVSAAQLQKMAPALTRPSPLRDFALGPEQIDDFIKRFDVAFSGRLSGFHNYSRVVSLAHFEALVNILSLGKQPHTGVVSGSLNEPELRFIQSDNVTVLNFASDRAFDLDEPWFERPSQNFSMTLCNQVLEHVFNPHLAFKNLIHVTRPDGYIYITIPTINCIHGEPHFYSSGYHPRFLERLAWENGVEVVTIGHWGSFKYLVNAVAGIWLPADQLARGASGGLPNMQDMDGRIKQDRIITDCWGLFKTRRDTKGRGQRSSTF
jgi:SAM-dependent methyltransferase